jgi:antitoxin VapB
METAKIFTNGRSQAVRIPKKYRFKSDCVLIYQRGDEIILKEKKDSWNDFFEQPSAFGEDFLNQREDLPPQERDLP